MQNNLKSPKITLPLLVAYVTELSTTLKDKDKNTDLLWVMENKDAFMTLNDQAHADKAENYGINDTSTTLLALAKQTSLNRYNLACFWLPTLTEEALRPYIPLMMRYRDLYAAHLIIAVSQEIDLRHYGLIPLDIFANQRVTPYAALDITIWQFNLYDYKPLPNWLNSDYWANPENWDKRRW